MSNITVKDVIKTFPATFFVHSLIEAIDQSPPLLERCELENPEEQTISDIKGYYSSDQDFNTKQITISFTVEGTEVTGTVYHEENVNRATEFFNIKELSTPPAEVEVHLVPDGIETMWITHFIHFDGHRSVLAKALPLSANTPLLLEGLIKDGLPDSKIMIWDRDHKNLKLKS